jgi:urease beta subunit
VSLSPTVRLAVDRFQCVVVVHREAHVARPLEVPLAEAVSAEPGEIHEVDVLHVGAFAQVRH